MHFIEIRQLSHVFTQEADSGKVEELALDNIDLNIDAGEFIAVIGMNGSGKSTLAKHLNGLLLPTSGKCLVDGILVQDDEKLWEIRRKVSMVFQNPDNQIIAAVVEDDIAFGPENIGVPPEEIRQRIDEALERLHITHLKHLAPHLLSGGQKQLVAIAGALAMRTKCIVLDEPTAMLDPQGRRLVMAAIRELHEKYGMTIILITHFMEEALQAQRMVVMDKGKIVTQGKPEEIFKQAKLLKSLGLTIPLAMDFAQAIREKGYKLPGHITNPKELAAALAEYMHGEGK